MKTIPRYWAYAPTKERGDLVWRSSPESEAAAQAAANEAAKRVSRYESGKAARPKRSELYPVYGVTLREKLLGELADARGEMRGFLTRNHVGAQVLNVRDVMFLDWDSPVPRKPGFLERFFRDFFASLKHALWGKFFSVPKEFQDWRNDPWSRQEEDWSTAPPEAWERDYPWAAVSELSAFMSAVTQMPDWGVRIYKTRAGYRGLVTHAAFDPAADATLDLMRQFRCDPQYITLCRVQESFRARLTPKGWRCGLGRKLRENRLPANFKFYYPARDAASAHAATAGYAPTYDAAVAAYEQATADFATCRYLGTVGNENIHPDIASVVALHDKITQALAETEMALA